jgi:hypothetical protein
MFAELPGNREHVMSDELSEITHILDKLDGIIPLAQMAWADQEIEAAQVRHGEMGRGPIWNSWRLLSPCHRFMAQEKLYRGHCREILDRVTFGEDTRDATDAEVLAALSAASLVSPLPEGAACLYFRVFKRTFPELWRHDLDGTVDLSAYESIHGYRADHYDDWLRTMLYQKERR